MNSDEAISLACELNFGELDYDQIVFIDQHTRREVQENVGSDHKGVWMVVRTNSRGYRAQFVDFGLDLRHQIIM